MLVNPFKLLPPRHRRVIGATLGVGVACYAAAKVYTAYRWTVSTDDEQMMRGLADLVDEGIVPPDDDEFAEGGVFGNLFEEAPDNGRSAVDRYTELAKVKGWRRQRVKWIVRAALAAKAKFGLVPDTPPNREMLSDHVRKLMVEHGLRPSHIVQQFPAAVALALLPSQTDVLLNVSLSTTIAEQRNREFNAPWNTFSFSSLRDRMLFGPSRPRPAQ